MAYVAPTNVSTGDVLTASRYNQDVVENVSKIYGRVRRLAHTNRQTNYTVTTTSGDIFSAAATFTADGTSTYLIEWFFPFAITGAATNVMKIMLYDSSTQIGRAEVYSAGSSIGLPVFGRRFWTPSSGSRSVNARAQQDAGTGELRQSDGVGNNYFEAYISVYGPILT